MFLRGREALHEVTSTVYQPRMTCLLPAWGSDHGRHSGRPLRTVAGSPGRSSWLV
ncbi:CASP-like protein [Psidium guajava]|nr:CASP-like protein [Psidium guajava]